MGNLDVTKLKTKKDRANYIHHLLNDIKALEMMIEKDPLRIHAEQEFCLINSQIFIRKQGARIVKSEGFLL